MNAHLKDKNYWNNYYQKNQHSAEISVPSPFATFCSSKINEIYGGKKVDVLEIGCGNGRDAEHLAIWHKVSACDLSEASISELEKTETAVDYFCADFTELNTGKYDVIYSRFTLHSVDQASENQVLHNVYNMLNEGGVFMVETRSNYDEICGRGEKISDYEWIYDGHYRRFNVLEDFVSRVKTIGYHPEFIQQSADLAPFGDRNPVVIRAIFKK